MDLAGDKGLEAAQTDTLQSAYCVKLSSTFSLLPAGSPLPFAQKAE